MVRLGDDDLSRQEQERERLIEEAKKNPPPSINKADAYTRGIFGILSGNEAILTAAIKGSNQDFLEVSSKMSDAELAGDIAFFVFFPQHVYLGGGGGAFRCTGFLDIKLSQVTAQTQFIYPPTVLQTETGLF